MADHPQTAHSDGCGAIQHWRRRGQGLEAVFQQGLLRLEAVAGDIFRVRFQAQGEFAPRRDWDVVQPQPAAEVQLRESDATVGLHSPVLSAEIECATGALSFYDAQGDPFAQDMGAPRWRPMALEEIPGLATVPDGELPPGPARMGMFLDKRMDPDEGYFGFGQRTGRLNRRHQRLSNWTVDRACPGHAQAHDNMYQAHPCFLALRPGRAWGLLLHSTWYSDFDVGATEADVLRLFTLGGELDYYLLAGPTPAAVLEQLTRLTGRPALPPLWSLGYHQSRWSYPDADHVAAIATEFRRRRIPLDVIHLDIDYMRGYRVFTWDPERFPHPEQTVARLRQQDIRTVVIVDPGVKNEQGGGYAVAEEGVAQGHFVKRPDGALFSGHVWPGEALFPDFCRAATRRWWGEWHASLVTQGVAGIWCDMNEPAIVDRPFDAPGAREQPMALASRQGEARALHAEVHNLYGHLMARATAEGLQRLCPQQRPWVLTRSACIGSQGHAVTWMGDNRSSWEDLAMSLPQVSSMGLCGAPHTGVDIGGFFGNSWGELYARWMELGCFYPFMRGHTATGTRPQEPWQFGPEVEAVARAAIELRYRLLPYLYTLAHLAHRSGAPILRPLCYDFPDQARFYELQDQLMFGPQLMVAPVTEPAKTHRLVELPTGIWYDFWSGARVDPGPLVHPAPLGRIPLFVRGGSVLTLGNLRQSTEQPLSQLTLQVYPGIDGEWTLIEDAGEGMGYTQGQIAETPLAVSQHEGGSLVIIGHRRGAFRPAPREMVLRLHLPRAPGGLICDGSRVSDWVWEPSHRCLRWQWRDDGQAHRIETVEA